jgi:hypothetical protein
MQPTAMRIAVVGAGPAGLALACWRRGCCRPPAHAVRRAPGRPRCVGRPAHAGAVAGQRAAAAAPGPWPAAGRAHPRGAWCRRRRPPGPDPGAAEVRIGAAEQACRCSAPCCLRAAGGHLQPPGRRRWPPSRSAWPAASACRWRPSAAGRGRGGRRRRGVETFDLAVVAEGGVFADQARKALAHDYRQTPGSAPSRWTARRAARRSSASRARARWRCCRCRRRADGPPARRDGVVRAAGDDPVRDSTTSSAAWCSDTCCRLPAACWRCRR